MFKSFHVVFSLGGGGGKEYHNSKMWPWSLEPTKKLYNIKDEMKLGQDYTYLPPQLSRQPNHCSSGNEVFP